MADGNHTLEASTAGCQSCHADLDTLDRNGVQTEIKALFYELEDLLIAEGLLEAVLDEEGERMPLTAEAEIIAYEPTGVHPVVGSYPEEKAGALWNYLIVMEDNSWGVHNPSWTKAILQTAIDALK